MAIRVMGTAVGGAWGVEWARAGVRVGRREGQGGGGRFIGGRLQLLKRLVEYWVCGAMRWVAVADSVKVKINRRWEPHVILTPRLGLALLSLSLSLTLGLVVVVRRLLVLVSVLLLLLLLLLHLHFHFGRLLVRPCFSWCGQLQRSSRALRGARSGPLIQVRPGTVRQEGVFWSRLSRHFKMTGALGQSGRDRGSARH